MSGKPGTLICMCPARCRRAVPGRHSRLREFRPPRPADLCSLDVLHLAAALNLGDDLKCIVAYDVRLADVASRRGIEVVTLHWDVPVPGSPWLGCKGDRLS